MHSQRLVVVASVLACTSLSAQVPTGYHVGKSVVIPDTLIEVLAGNRFRATVARGGRTPQERELIAVAESLYPDSAALLSASPDAKEPDQLAAIASGVSPSTYKVSPRAAGSSTDRWWYDDFDGTWVPYAVTAGAVDYYLFRLRDLAAGRGQFVYAPGQPPDRGTLSYKATIRRSTQPGVSHVVELRISWDYWCGMLCAMSFTHVRTISFDATGRVLRIVGDGRPEVGAS
jgi:hypothetical protein